MAAYLYTLRQPFSYRSALLAGVSFWNQWLRIDRDGTITISEGYSWDGCSPKWSIAGRAFGVPDGPIQADGYPQTAWASLVHDALCQFRRWVPVTKRQTVELFREMLALARWECTRLYVFAVNYFGPQRFAGDLITGGV